MNASESAHASNPVAKVVRAARSLTRRVLHRLLRSVLARLDRVEHLVHTAHLKGDAAHEKCDAIGGRVELLTRRQDEVTAEVQTALAFGWDYVALVRRLAVLEDQVSALGGDGVPSSSEDHAALEFPGLHKHAALQAKNA